MASWTDVATLITSLAAGKAFTDEKAQALAENVVAMGEGATDAQVILAGWHPYNATAADVVNGDGVFYDFAVDGSVASIETPDFEDGYEYRMICVGMSSNTTGDWNFSAYRESAAAYATDYTVAATNNASDFVGGDVEIVLPRLVKNHVTFRGNFLETTLGGDSFASVFATIPPLYITTAQKILRMRLDPPGNLDAGKAYLLRRWDYLTGY